MKVRFKIRHQPNFNHATISLNGENVLLNSAEAISGVAPGQFGVLYHAAENWCLGSGVIDQ